MLPAFPTIADLHARYAQDMHPAEVISEIYQRIPAVNDPGIFITLLPEANALAAAERQAAHPARLLHPHGLGGHRGPFR